MTESVEASGHTVEEAIDAALEMLGATEDEVEIQILSEGPAGGMLRKSNDARVRVRLRDERTDEDIALERHLAEEEVRQARRLSEEQSERQADAAERFLTGLLDVMRLDGRVNVHVGEFEVKADIAGTDLALLIGRHGNTLAALQELVRGAVQKDSPERVAVMVDVEGYLVRRIGTLERMAHNAASKARKTRRSVSLEPMPARDRKIVHDALTGVPGIRTGSEGDEPQRYVVISPL